MTYYPHPGQPLSVSSLTTTGAITVGTTLTVDGASTLTGAVTMSASATVGTTLGVTGAVTMSAAATVGTTLGVTGATTLSDTLAVTGATTLSSTLGVTGISSLAGWKFAAHKQNITTADLTDAATSQAVAITGFPANSIPVYGRIYINTVLSGGSISAATAELGDAGASTGLITAEDIFTGATTGVLAGTDGAEAGFGTAALEAAYSPICTVRTTSDNVDAATACDFDAYIFYMGIEATA